MTGSETAIGGVGRRSNAEGRARSKEGRSGDQATGTSEDISRSSEKRSSTCVARRLIWADYSPKVGLWEAIPCDAGGGAGRNADRVSKTGFCAASPRSLFFRKTGGPEFVRLKPHAPSAWRWCDPTLRQRKAKDGAPAHSHSHTRSPPTTHGAPHHKLAASG